jgi:hypothetical protein
MDINQTTGNRGPESAARVSYDTSKDTKSDSNFQSTMVHNYRFFLEVM